MKNHEGFVGRIKDNWQLRASEKTTFKTELRIIPRRLIWTLSAGYFLALAFVAYLSIFAPSALPGALVREPLALRLLGMFGIASAAAAVLGGFAMLMGYIGGDAKRRGMIAWLWVLVALLVPYLLGVILYFVVREPLPFKCPQCGAAVTAQFNFCPSCKFNLRPNCPECRLALRAGGRFCPHCGFSLHSDAPAQGGANAV